MAIVSRVDRESSSEMDVDIRSSGLEEDLRIFAELVEVAELKVDGWRVPYLASSRPCRFERVLERVQAYEPSEFQPAGFGAIEGGEEWLGYCHHGETARIMTSIGHELSAKVKLKRMRAQRVILRHLLRSGQVVTGDIRRQGSFGRWLPELSLLKCNILGLVTTKAEVEAAFEQPDVFWNAGWDSVEQFGEQWLLTRGLEDFDSVSWVERAAPHYWAMARAAKPGQCRYYWVTKPHKAEQDVYSAGRQTLEPVGFLKQERVAEYSCLLEPGEHISGWEILGLAGIRETGKLPRGRKVEAVRVVFLDRETAEREKRPLVEVGVEVWCYGPDGERERVE